MVAPGSGGEVASGGAGVGGNVGTGGATGGSQTSASSGGMTSAGGLIASGGTAMAGGSKSSGGTTNSGGAVAVGGTSNAGGARATGGSFGAGGSISAGGTTSLGGSKATGGTTTSGSLSACVPCSFMGKDKVMIGGSFWSDSTATQAPWDARYMYLSSGIPVDASKCTTSSACGTSACNTNNGNSISWWGCWSLPPGKYVTDLITKCEGITAKPLIPVVTYYEEYQTAHAVSGVSEGTSQVSSLNNATVLTEYLNDWRLVVQSVGQHKAMLHIEPDMWGYVKGVNSNPHSVPAMVTTANPTDCAAEENSAAGLALCMIHMVRKYAPNAMVGLHASPWNYGGSGDGVATGNFMKQLGAAESDFLVTDPSDRDAGYYETVQGKNTWWTDTSAQNFLNWSKTVAETVCKPMVLWQIPVGNMNLDNTATHYKDNRVDWFMANMPKVAAAHVVMLLFGGGESTQTRIETDGGNLIAKTTAYWQAGGTSICQ